MKAENTNSPLKKLGFKKDDMRGNAIRTLMVLLTILPLPLTVLAAQKTTSLSIDRQVGEIRAIQVQAQEQAQSPSGQPFSLRNGVTIHLSGGWGPDTSKK